MSPSVVTAPPASEPRFDKKAEAPKQKPQPEPAPFAPAWNPEFAPLR